MPVVLRLVIVLSASTIISISSLLAAPTNTSYSLSINFTNTICTITGGPSTANALFPFVANSIALQTDGSGNISGSGWFWVDYSNAPYSAFLVEVKGKIVSTAANSAPKVTLAIDGPGYTLDGQGDSTPNSIHLKFTGQPGPSPVDDAQTAIVGKMAGTISGSTPLGARSAAVNLDAMITDVTFTTLSLNAKVQQTPRQMFLFNAQFTDTGEGNPIFDLTGSGQINSSAQTYRFSAKGIGAEKGWTLTVSGSLGTNTSSAVPGAQFLAPVSAQVHGKVQGQAVSGSTTDIEAELVNGTTSK